MPRLPSWLTAVWVLHVEFVLTLCLPSFSALLSRTKEWGGLLDPASLLFWVQFFLQAVSFVFAFTDGNFFISSSFLPKPLLTFPCALPLHPCFPLSRNVHLSSRFDSCCPSLQLIPFLFLLKLRSFTKHVPVLHGCYMPTLLLNVFFKVQKMMLCYVLYPKHFLVSYFALMVYWAFSTGCPMYQIKQSVQRWKTQQVFN